MTAQSFESIGQAWRLGRAVQRVRRPRKSYVKAAIHAAAKALPTWQKVRTTVLSVAALGSMCYGAFQFNQIVGFISMGAALLVVEAKGGAQ